MLSLILDGKDNWEMYHHMKISADSLEVIRAEAKKLQTLARWEGRIQFLNNETMEKVKEIWKCYKKTPNLVEALKMRKQFVGETKSAIGGVLSAEPFMFAALADLSKPQDNFWREGTVDGIAEYSDVSLFPNPLFFSSSIMHYTTDPLAGFHVALGHVPIKDGLRGSIAAAKAEFACWTRAFRKSPMTIKFCWADSLSFCYAIQGFRTHRDNYSTSLLVLDSQKFDMVDASNEAEDVGFLNVMVASSPILKPGGLLRMEHLIIKDKSDKSTEILNGLLHGDLLVISSLLGLSPMEYGTNASPACTIDSRLLQNLMRSLNAEDPSTEQTMFEFRWMAVPVIVFDARQLSNILYSIYRSMFESESISKRMDNITPGTTQSRLLYFPYFHQGSFAHLLRAVQASSDDWETTITRLLRLIESNQDIAYIQELYLHLQLFGLLPTSAFEHPRSIGQICTRLQRLWFSKPDIVWLTIKIPRINLWHISVELDNLPVHGFLETADGQGEIFFAAIQMVFGEIRTTGSADTLNVHITEDADGLEGISPMFVSFRVPSWVLGDSYDKPNVGFGLQTITTKILDFTKKLGPDLKIFMTSLGDSANVFITKSPPNSSSEASVTIPSYPSRYDGNTQGFIANGKLQSMGIRINTESANEKLALIVGIAVVLRQLTPWELEVQVVGYKHQIKLPVPVSTAHCKSLILRESPYLKLVAPPLSAEDRYTMSPFPVSLTGTGPRLLNMPRVSLDMLPALDTKGNMSWLKTHLAMSFSASETEAYRLNPETTTNPRIHFKNSLLSLYKLSSGLEGNVSHAQPFALFSKTSQHHDALIFVNELRLDLSGRTVLLDVAILSPFKISSTNTNRALTELLAKPFVRIEVSDVELKIWRNTIPAFIERCRTWSHSDTCEYQQFGRIPLPYNPPERFICTCGNGVFPDGYLKAVPDWSDLAGYCVRAAISPCFAVPYVDEL